ncbi:Swi2/Snf2-Like family protein [Planoprotostelium fungivorum]|uniref:Swi2/Snf2-Like family protein n=1 Tax=Planoprotostelium fungivorum TaxID=1890364 RepID=A0A2P6MN69_9EUKA|nr:Swi2/Snf2-Like family protein [Planoprotostelium fungivorum]
METSPAAWQLLIIDATDVQVRHLEAEYALEFQRRLQALIVMVTKVCRLSAICLSVGSLQLTLIVVDMLVAVRGPFEAQTMLEQRRLAIGARQDLLAKALALRERHLRELLFLQSGGNLLDFHTNQHSSQLNESLERYHNQNPIDLAINHDSQLAIRDLSSTSKNQGNGATEDVAVKAAKDSEILKRVIQLQKEGLWSGKRMNRVQEPPRGKVHWDNLLAEMAWLAADFKAEKKRKTIMAKKIGKMTLKHFADIRAKENKEIRDEEARMKKMAKDVGNDVKRSWGQVEKLLQYMKKMEEDEEKRKAMDQHLDKLVEQTEKYSEMLASDMKGEAPMEVDENTMDSSKAEEATEVSPKETQPADDSDLTSVTHSAEQAQPTGFTLSTTEVKTKVPFLIRAQLREYQHIGLDWLVSMYSKGLNGILADEMGLGKTLMTISMLAYLACEKENWGPHLIIVPTTLILNWELELKKWCPAFKVLSYYGNPKERKLKRIGWSKPNAFHVCITSYKLAIQDSTVFKKKKWVYMILDEAHHIKNFKSQRWQTLLTFNSERRLLLTGTPLQNDLMELWSLMHFLMPKVFESHSEFKEWFSNPMNAMVTGEMGRNEDVIRRLHGILRPFLLRRLKSQVEKQLPPKFSHVVTCKLSKRQRFLYEEFMQQSNTRDTLSSGNFLGIVNVLMQLRKVCNHPDLFEVRPIVSSFDQEPISLDFPSLVWNLQPANMERDDAIRRLFGLNDLDLTTHQAQYIETHRYDLKAFVDAFSGNVPPSTTDFHNVLSQYQPADIDRQSIAERLFHNNEIRCRDQIYHYDTIRTLLSVPALQRDSLQREYDWDAWGLHELRRRPVDRVNELQWMIHNFVFCIPQARTKPPALYPHHPVPWHTESQRRMVNSLHALYEPSKLLRQPFIRSQIYFPDKRLIQYDCGKLQQLDRLLSRLKSGGHRALIFTQMTRMLDILEIFLNIHGHTYLRLDGSTGIEKRQMMMERFNRDSKIFLFILSTRSGGVGVNLTGADTVIFYDSDWNPAMDAQAQDRCHRIGQTREVHIYRLINEYTVEENILNKSNQKKELDDMVIDAGSFTTDFFKKLDLRDLIGGNRAFEENDAPQVSEKDWVKAIAQVEETSDRNALAAAEKEIMIETQDFNEESTSSTAPSTTLTQSTGVQITEEVVEEVQEDSTTFPFEEQLNPIQRYMLKFLQQQQNVPAPEEPRVEVKEEESQNIGTEVKEEEKAGGDREGEDNTSDDEQPIYYEVMGGSSSLDLYISSVHHYLHRPTRQDDDLQRDNPRRPFNRVSFSRAAQIYAPPNPDLDEIYIPPLDDLDLPVIHTCEWMASHVVDAIQPSWDEPWALGLSSSKVLTNPLIPPSAAKYMIQSAILAGKRARVEKWDWAAVAENLEKTPIPEPAETPRNFSPLLEDAEMEWLGEEKSQKKRREKEVTLPDHTKTKKRREDEEGKSKDKKKKKEKKEKKKKHSEDASPALPSSEKNRKKSEKSRKKKRREDASSSGSGLPVVDVILPWCVDEDLAILEAKSKFGTNWDLITDIVNSVPHPFRRRRSKKHIYERWKTVLAEEEGFQTEKMRLALQNNEASGNPNSAVDCRPSLFSVLDVLKKMPPQKKRGRGEESKPVVPLSRPNLKSVKGPSELSVAKLHRMAAKIAENNANASVSGQAQRLSNSLDKLTVKGPTGQLRAGPKSSAGASHLNATKVLDTTLSSLSGHNQTDPAAFARTAIKNPAFQKDVPASLPQSTSLILNSNANNNNSMSRSLAQINQTVGTNKAPTLVKGPLKTSVMTPVLSPTKRVKAKAAGPPAPPPTPPPAVPAIPPSQSIAPQAKLPVKKSTVKSPPPIKAAGGAPPQQPKLPVKGSAPPSLSSQLARYSMAHHPESAARVQEIMNRKDVTETQKSEELKKIIKELALKKGIPLPGGIT